MGNICAGFSVFPQTARSRGISLFGNCVGLILRGAIYYDAIDITVDGTAVLPLFSALR